MCFFYVGWRYASGSQYEINVWCEVDGLKEDRLFNNNGEVIIQLIISNDGELGELLMGFHDAAFLPSRA